MASSEELQRITLLLERFISGERRSREDSREIEVSLDDAFPDDDEIQDFVTDFASYRPGGGDFLYDEAAMEKKCRELLAALAERTSRLPT